jgi:hypothetical protein
VLSPLAQTGVYSLRRLSAGLSSYGEVVLAPQATDRRHPAFNKLFIESEEGLLVLSGVDLRPLLIVYHHPNYPGLHSLSASRPR